MYFANLNIQNVNYTLLGGGKTNYPIPARSMSLAEGVSAPLPQGIFLFRKNLKKNNNKMKDTTQKTATFLRQLALTLIVALLVAAQTAWAQDLSKLTYDVESETYSISSEQDLKTLSAYVEAGNNCEGLTFQVTTSIQFTTEPSPGESNFTAIGTSAHPFCGTFDGGNTNGYSIKGIVINASTDYQGLFGCVGKYGKYATIRNVTIEDSEINSTAGSVGGTARAIFN